MNLLRILWRIWYYLVIGVAIVLLFPFILVTALVPQWHKAFFWFARLWGKTVVKAMGFRLHVDQKAEVNWNKPFVVIANHTSEIDIMATLALAEGNWLFIGKAELARIPVFGFFYKRTNILVDRASLRSRREVYTRAQEKIEQDYGVCIYPEGGIPDTKWRLAPFKMGAFRLAVETGVPIIPITFVNNKERFPEHWSGGGPGKLHCIIHKPIITTQMNENDVHVLRRKAYRIINETLKGHHVEGKEQYQ